LKLGLWRLEKFYFWFINRFIFRNFPWLRLLAFHFDNLVLGLIQGLDRFIKKTFKLGRKLDLALLYPSDILNELLSLLLKRFCVCFAKQAKLLLQLTVLEVLLLAQLNVSQVGLKRRNTLFSF